PVVLKFQPIVGSCSRHIRTVCILPHYSFQTFLRSYIKQRLSLLFNMVAELDSWERGILNQNFEDLLATKERKPSQISAIKVEKVKDVVDEMIYLSAFPMT